MQIRTFFHNSNFLRKSVRRLVCVLFMLVACAGAVWGANAYYIWIGGNEGNLWSDPRNWKYSSSGTNYQTQSSGGYYPGDGRSTDKQIWFPGTDNGTFYIVVDREIHTGELGFHSDETGMASTYIFSTTNGGSIEASSISVKAPPDSSEKSVLNFGNVPVTVTNGDLNINAGETAGTVEIATDASITITGTAMSSGYPSNGKINIGNSANSGSNDTKTVFSGTGTITARALDFPSAHNHEFTVDSGATLNFASSNSNPYIFTTSASNSSVTINGTGTIDLAGVSYNHPDSFATEPGLTVLNGSGTYTYTLTEGSRTGFPSSSFSIEITASTTDGSFDGSKANLTYKLEQTETKFTFNGSSNASGSITLSGSGTTYSGTYSIACTSSGSLVAGEGFKLTVYQPGNIGLGIVEWYVPSASWTGANGTNWNDSANWTGVTDPTSLSDKDITIEACTNLPVINSGTITVKSLTIKNGASVTQEGGTLTAGSMTCEAGGTFTATGGTVSFNGTAGTWSDADGNSVFSSLAISAGTLTLSSPLHLTGDFDGSGGTLVQGSNAVIFEGSGTQSLLGSTSCSLVTVESGATLDCNGKMLTVSGTLKNNGTIVCPGGMLSCGTYTPASDLSDIVSVSGSADLVTTNGVISKIKVTDTATLSGTPKCRFFEATGLGGKTLTINGSVTVGSGVTGTAATQTLQLSGTSTGSKLEIAGSGLIKLNASQVGGQYLDVTGTAKIHDASDGTTVSFTTTYSTGPAIVPAGWNICENGLVYVWTGSAGSSTWNAAGNWSVGMVPSGTSDDVEIPSGCSVYPVTPSAQLSINSLTVESGASVSVADSNKLRFVSYSGDGVIKLGTGNIEVRSAGTNCTIQNIEFTGTGTRSFADISKVTLVNLKVPSGKTLQLSADLTLTGEMDNAGTIDTNGRTLTFKTYTGAGTVQIGTAGNVAVGSSGTGGTIQNVVFAGTRGYEAPANISFTNGTVNSGVTLTVNTNLLSFAGDLINKGSIMLSSAGLTVAGNIDNQGTVNCNNRPFTFASYSNSRAGTVTDKILTNGIGGSVTCTGSGTGSGAVTYAELNGSSVVTNSGTDALTFTKAIVSSSGSSLTLTNSGSGSIAFGEIQVSANATLTPGSAVISKLSVNNTTTTLTLNDALSVTGTLTNNGTLNATGGALSATTLTNTGTLISSGGALSVTGTLTNQSGGTVSCNGFNLTAGTLSNSGSVSLTAATGGSSLTCTTYAPSGSDSMTLSGDVTLSIGTNRVGTINLSSGTLNAPSGLNVGTLNVTGGSVAVSGTVSAITVYATGLGGETFTVAGTLGVSSSASDALKLEGTSVSSHLTVTGNGSIQINGSKVGGKWLSVTSSGPRITDWDGNSTLIYTATYSVPSGTTDMEFNGWYICNEGLVYKWNGAVDEKWTREANWSVGIVPSGSSDEVLIPDSLSTYPETPSSETTVGNLTVESGAELTVKGRFSVDAASNAGTVNAEASTAVFRFNNYSGAGVIRLGAGSVEARSAASTTPITNIELTGTGIRDLANISKITFVNLKVPAGKTLRLTGALTLTGKLTNGGTVNTNGHLLTIGSYADVSSTETGLVQIAGNNALALNSGGTGGTITNLEFTADCSFSAVSNISITNAEVKSGVTLTAGSDLVFGGQFANSASNSTVILSGCNLTAKNFSGSGSYSISGAVELESTDSSEAGAGILELVKSSGTASLKQTGLFLIRKLSAESGTLTLNSSIKVVDLTIKQSAAVSAGPSSSSAYTLTIRGNFVNENTGADPVSSVYPGFDAKQSTVELVDNPDVSETPGTDIDQIHYVKGFNRFYNFTCTTASTKGAKVYFDADKTTRIESQLTLGVPASDGGYLVLDTPPGSADDRKWTLDITWNIHGVNDPVIQRVKPHHAISYRAILHDCLIDCIDDGVIDIDSTNKNWFDDMPSILMTLAPIGGRQLFVLFSTEVDAADGRDLRTSIALKKSSDATNLDATNLIDDSIPVEEYKGSTGKSKSGIVFTLTRDITWTDLTGSDPLYVEIIDTDAVLKGGSIIPYLQFTKHCLSDYAVNAVRMLFGYDNNIDPSTPLTVETGTNSVRAWDSTNPVVNRLHSESDLLFQAQLEQSVDTGIQLDMVAMLSSQLNTSVIGNNFKDYYGFTTRIWQPFELLAVSTGQQSIPSGQIISQDGTSSGRLRNFSIHYNKSAADALFTVPDGDEIQFMFKLLDSTGNDITIDHDCDGTTGQKPLYAIRLRDDSDITSFDLWSVALQSTTLQRGNVTILNNVINSDQREQTFVTIQLEKAGSLTVQVLTLDGAVVTTLQRGRKNAGTYGFSWDGTNGKGRPVARGMYFIRIIGPDIDETRKVMVVRD